MTEPRVALLVRVPASLKSRLAEIAKHERRSLSKQVELLLESCLELQGQQSSTLTPSARSGSHIIPRWAKQKKKKTRQKEQPAEP
jgi:hypothetical protein